MSAGKMRKLFFLLLTAAAIANADAQPGKWGVSFTPAFLATNEPRYAIQAGVEYRINDKLSILTELAIRTGANKDSSAYHVRYLRIKPEIRYVFTNRPSNVQYYMGGQLSYSFRKWDELNGGFYFNDHLYEDSTVTYDRAELSSPIATASLQGGVLIGFGRHISLDIFSGTGIRVIHTKYTDLVNSGKGYYQQPKCKIIFSPDPAYWVNGTVTRFHLNAGFRLIWRF